MDNPTHLPSPRSGSPVITRSHGSQRERACANPRIELCGHECRTEGICFPCRETRRRRFEPISLLGAQQMQLKRRPTAACGFGRRGGFP